MTVTEVLSGLGQWSLRLSSKAPADVRSKLGILGHIAILRGELDVASVADTTLLQRARYVGVCRRLQNQNRTISGVGVIYWLGDEDGKGHTIEPPGINLVDATLQQALTAVLPITVALGTVHPLANPAQRYTHKHVIQSRREALTLICDAFGVEFRVNGDTTVDVGRPDQLYNTSAATVDTVIKRDATGSDIDLTAVTGTYDTDVDGKDLSTRVLLVGETTGESGEVTDTFVTAVAEAPVIPWLDQRGNPVRLTRVISDSRQNADTAPATVQLNLNRFNRVTRTLTVDADQYQADGAFVVGDNTFVYDPESGVFDPARQRDFRGELIRPDLIRISSITWPIARGHTVAFRTIYGEWVDLTRWVEWEGASGGDLGTGSGLKGLGTGGLSEIVVGDLPRSLTGSTGNVVSDRIDAAKPNAGDASIPKAPTWPATPLTTTASLDTYGRTIAYIRSIWQAPTQNTDNTPLTDLSHFEMRYRAQMRAPSWSGSIVTEDLSFDLVAVNGLAYDVEVRAVDKAGNTSAWSSTQSITAAVETTAPGTPSKPQTASVMTLIRIWWDGLTSTGTGMPSDFMHLEVHVGTTAGFTPVISGANSTLAAELATAGFAHVQAPPFTTRYIKFVAVDNNRNRSPVSEEAQGMSSQVVSDDIFIGAVGSSKLADLAVIRAKIADLAVNDAKIGDLSVGKLTAGMLLAEVIMGNRFTTASTGARVELNTLGFQGFRANGTKWLSLTPTEALITGFIRTADAGRRIEIGASGNIGRIAFIAADGAQSFLQSYTDGLEAREGLQLGTTIDGAPFMWNSIFYNQQEWASYHTKIHDFVYQDRFSIIQTANRGANFGKTRLTIDQTAMTMRGGLAVDDNAKTWSYNYLSGNVQHYFTGGGRIDFAGGFAGQSPWTTSVATDGWGVIFRATSNGLGAFADFRNIFDSGFTAIRAAAFQVDSDERGKHDIVDEPITDALAQVRQIRPRRYKRNGAGQRPVVDKSGTMVAVIDGEAPDEIGAVAQELPAFARGGTARDGYSLDLVKSILLLAASVSELDDRTKKGKAA